MRGLALLVGLISTAFLLLASSALAATQPATFTTQTYPLLGNSHVAADLNGDGKLDLAGSGANSADVMLNNGDGTFRPKVNYPSAGQTQDVAAGDFNGDGRIDLAVTIDTPQVSLSLLTGNGDGTFNPPVNFPNTSGFDSPNVLAIDLNNDGKLDLAIMHSIACFTAPCTPARTISVMLGNGNGTFQPTREIEVGIGMHRMSAGDFNRDGIKDLAIGAENTQLYTLLGVGDGTFVQQPTIVLVPGGDLFSAGNDVGVADFNRDGIQDLAVALGNGDGTAILIGNGDGTFGQPFRVLDNAVDAPQSLAAADYNRDGFPDIARAIGFGNRGLMDILQGNGDGTFQPALRYLVPAPLSSQGGIWMISADFNLDSMPDIALEVGGASAALKVSLNSTGASAPPPQSTLTPTPTRTTAATPPAPPPQATSTPTRTATTTAAGTPTGTPTVTVTPTRPPDAVSITRAEYSSGNRELRIEATSSNSNAVLRAYVTSSNQLIGTLTNNGGGTYGGRFTWPGNPQNVTVLSSLRGSATKVVTAK